MMQLKLFSKNKSSPNMKMKQKELYKVAVNLVKIRIRLIENKAEGTLQGGGV